jgi:hypothetical protein
MTKDNVIIPTKYGCSKKLASIDKIIRSRPSYIKHYIRV